VIRAAFRSELRKMWKRPATWVTLGLFAAITFADLLDAVRDARKDPANPFTLPGAWPQILGEEVMIGFIFAAVLAILLVASEFSWRTARQNVIDGLSKSQWYAAKALLLPLLAALFLGLRVVTGGALALAGTDHASGAAAFGPVQLAAIGGMWLTGLGYTTLALFVATAIRSSGPAMAVWFAWFAFGERLLVGGLGSLFEGLRPVLRWAPMMTFNRLRNYLVYDSEALRHASELAVSQDRAPPQVAAVGPAVFGSLAWIAALLLLGWWWYRRRDL
jgi:ABC-type transport system involved in multi-copper enzyme maturation permease subunit